jgi:hypothetical protein
MAITPIALFTYNRPEHTAVALESLSQCSRLDESRLFIYCDGPSRPEHVEAVAESRRVVRDWVPRLGAQVIERDDNLGLAASIVSGVTELCERYGRVIVLEDDLVLNPRFVDFMIQALDRYEHESRVYQVSGYMFPVAHEAATDAFFLPLTTTWGWGTWARAWRDFDCDVSGVTDFLRDPAVRLRFDLDNSYPYSNMLEGRLNGENDSWGILFWWYVFRAEGLALHPRESLVWNGGFDNSGTHCGDRSWSNQPPAEVVTREHSHGFSLPEKVIADDAAFNRIKQFLRREQYPTSLTGRLWRRLERYAVRTGVNR